jgi:magnesium chelatase family protein
MLFLNELPEFKREAVERIDRALETGRHIVARGSLRAEFPTRPRMLILGIPTCFCVSSIGIGKTTPHAQSCPREKIATYRARNLDRLWKHVDIAISLDPVDRAYRQSHVDAERMHGEIAERIAAARKFISERRDEERDLPLTSEGRIADTIAGLAGRRSVEPSDIAEASELTKGLLS